MADISKLNGYDIKDATARANIDIVPDYVKTEAEATITKAFSHGNLGRTIRFIAVSDAHNESNGKATVTSEVGSDLNPELTRRIRQGNLHCGQAINYITKRLGMDFIAFLGDTTWAGVQTASYNQTELKNDVFEMWSNIGDGFKGIPNVRCVGNHDQFLTQSDSTRLFNSGAYGLFGRFCYGKKDNPGGYGYFDLENSNVRVIYLNTSDLPSSTAGGTKLAMTPTQKNWLCETLIDLNTKSDASAWKILILSHCPADWSEIYSDVLSAYANGGTYGTYTFTNHDAHILANCHGHTHSYCYGYINEKIRRFSVPNACYADNNHYSSSVYGDKDENGNPITYNKTADSGDDTAFSLVTIDLDSNMCYVDNYGAGIDREFSCDYNASIVNLIETLGVNANTRINSSGKFVIDGRSSGLYTINYIPIELGDIIRLKGFTMPTVAGNPALATYTESGGTYTKSDYVNPTTATVVFAFLEQSITDGIISYEVVSEPSEPNYFSFSLQPTSSINDCIVTKNQAIPTT